MASLMLSSKTWPHASFNEYPFNVPVVRDLHLEFRKPVTLLIGETNAVGVASFAPV
jgi:predicted ATPase